MRTKHYKNNISNVLKDKTLICGLHTCQEALASPSTNVSHVYLIEDKKYPAWVYQIDKSIINYVSKEFLSQLLHTPDIAHQGIAMRIVSNKSEDLFGINGTIVVLDNVSDPHNVGAIIRSAAVFGIKAIVLHNRSACKITSTVAKTSSGGINHVQICSVPNIATTIKSLKKYGFWVVSLSESGNKYLHEVDLKGKICLILGAENIGVRRLQLENSDFVVKIPTTAHFSTLNVSNAAAIAFYELARQNEFRID